MNTTNQNHVINEAETSNLKDSAAMENNFVLVTVEDLKKMCEKYYSDEPIFILTSGVSVWFVCGHRDNSWFFVRETDENYITSANGLLEMLNEGDKNADEEMRNDPRRRFKVYTNKFIKLDNLNSLIETYKNTELFQLLLWLNWQIGR